MSHKIDDPVIIQNTTTLLYLKTELYLKLHRISTIEALLQNLRRRLSYIELLYHCFGHTETKHIFGL